MEETTAGTLEFKVHLRKGRNGRNQIRLGGAPEPADMPDGSVPRITKLMALAIKLDGMIQSGEVKDYAELAALGHVSRARITQIMNLLQLAPDIQEEILLLPRRVQGRDKISLRKLQSLTQKLKWSEQRKVWQRLMQVHVQ